MKYHTLSVLTLCSLALGACKTTQPDPKKYDLPTQRNDIPQRETTKSKIQSIPNEDNQKPSVVLNEIMDDPAIRTGIAIKGKPNLILSPYAPTEGFIDVSNFAPGNKIKDPYTGNIIRVPLQGDNKATTDNKGTAIKETTLSNPNNTNNTPPTIE
jgi:hypothetical protein